MSAKLFTASVDIQSGLVSATRAPEAIDGLLLWWAGYIADAEGLTRNLGLEGSGLDRTAALFARAYRRWGGRLSSHVDGEFAVAVLDPATKTACLSHDELGICPLFYRASGRRLEFGTDLLDLTDRVSRSPIDEEYIADLLATGEHLDARTPFESICRLLPGHALHRSPSGTRLIDCRTLNEEGISIEDSDELIDEQFRQLAGAAVAAATSGETKLLCELSGGLDSSSTFSLANRRADGTIKAVSTIYPQSPSADETDWIAQALQGSPAPWLTIDADAHGHYTQLPADRFAEPSLLAVKAAWRRAYRDLLESNNVEAVITGEGGDAVLYGDSPQPLFMADQMLKGQWRRLWRSSGQWGAGERGDRSRLYALRRYAIGPGWRHRRGEQLHRIDDEVPWLAEEYAGAIATEKRSRRRAQAAPAASVSRASRLEQVAVSARNASKFYHQIDPNVPFRHPLMNRPLLRFMLALPDAQRFSPRRDRIVQRRALAGVVPAAILERQDKGGGSEPWIRGLERCDVWPEILTVDPLVVRRGYFDRARWLATVDQARVGRFMALKYFDTACAVEAWLRADAQWRSTPDPNDVWPYDARLAAT